MLQGLPNRRQLFNNRNSVKKKQKLQKKQESQLTPEQIAELNLIQISDAEFDHVDLMSHQELDFRKLPETPPKTPVNNRKSIMRLRDRLNHHQSQQIKSNRSTQLRISVTQRLTQSFKAGMKQNGLQIQTDQVCVLKRKLAINLSNYVVLGNASSDESKKFEPKRYLPRPSINSRTFYNKKKLNWFSDSNYEVQSARAQLGRKLAPLKKSRNKI